MAVITYEIPSERIVHETRVDFSYRSVQKPIHIVQYDKQLPIIAVSLYVSGKTYTLPENMDVNVKFGKRDRTFIYKPVLGCNDSRNVVYFEVDEQMSFLHGPVNPILELSFIDGGETQRAGSSSIAIEIDRNPIQESDIESSNEYSIDGYVRKEEMLNIIEDETLVTLTRAASSTDFSFDTTEYIQISFNGVEKYLFNTEILNTVEAGRNYEYVLEHFDIDATTISIVIDNEQKVSTETVAKFLDLRKSYFYDSEVTTMSIVIDGIEYVIEEIEVYTDSTPEDSYVFMYLPDIDTYFQFSYTGVIDVDGLLPDANTTLTFNINAYSGEIRLDLYRQTDGFSVYTDSLNSTDVVTIVAVHKTGLLSTVYDKTEVYNKAESDKLIATEILYADLLQLTYSNALQVGTQYRIIDYETVVNPTIENVRSVNKLFDIIVTAISNRQISTSAIAVQSNRSGALSFSGTWKIEYTLGNYTSVGSNGKGTILRMTDTNNNSLPYDFKNIQFYVEPSRLTNIGLSSQITSDNYYYTFSRKENNLSADTSSYSSVFNNYISTNGTPSSSITNYASVFISISSETIANNTFNRLSGSILSNCYGNTVYQMLSCDMRNIQGNTINSINNVIATSSFKNNSINRMSSSQAAVFDDNTVGNIQNVTFVKARENYIIYMLGCKVGDDFNNNALHCKLSNVTFGNSAEELFNYFVGNTWIGNQQFSTIVNNPELYTVGNRDKGILIQQAGVQSEARYSYYNIGGTLIEGSVTV